MATAPARPSALQLYQELETLQREWILERERYLIRDARGRVSSPDLDHRTASFGTIFGVLVLLFFIFFTAGMGAPFLVPMGGGIVLLIFVLPLTRKSDRANPYRAALRRYEQRREEIVKEMERRQPNRW